MVRLNLFLVTAVAVVLVACSDNTPQTQPDQGPPPADTAKAPGTEGGPCYGNGTCNSGLVCLSNLCVRDADSGGPDLPGDGPVPDGAGPDVAPDVAQPDLSDPDLPGLDVTLPVDAPPLDALIDAQATDQSGDAAQPKVLSWVTAVLDQNNAGKHVAIAACGATLGIAYFRDVPPVTVTCPGPSGGAKQRPAQDLYFLKAMGSTWSAAVKVDQTYGPAMGVDLAFNPSNCKAFIGYLGGGLSQQECSSSDAVIQSSTTGAIWVQQVMATAGVVGDTVGHWMSLAIDGTGQAHASYRDVHFGLYEQDGNTKSSLWYDTIKATGDNGSGVWSTLVFSSNGQPVIAHYNAVKTGLAGGILVEAKQPTGWTSQQVVAGTTEGFDFATNGAVFGVAFQAPAQKTLFYTEAGSGLSGWTAVQADASGTNTGMSPSLAFDSQGNPAISYYRCGPASSTSCDATQDGLMFAIRLNGTWQTYEIETGGQQFCGNVTALTFNASDEPVIGYQCLLYDNLTNQWVQTLKVARGQWN